ncbi:MAG: hypothetical protein FIA94_00225 [Nitrospirae bacterium]|nr:hypothetical protein [Nitrospirota bacterium]
MLCNLSKLDDVKLQEIKNVEQKVGKTLLAYSCYNVAPADLSKDQISLIAEAEKKLGIVLVAVKA